MYTVYLKHNKQMASSAHNMRTRVQENLAMQRAGLQQQGFGNLASLLGMGIQTPTFQYQNIPGTQGMLNPLFQGLGSGVGQMGGMMGAGWLGKKLGFFGG